MNFLRFIIIFIAILGTHNLFSQFDMSANSQTVTLTGCSGTLLDPGLNGNYGNNLTKTIIIQAPNSADHVKLVFTMFQLGSATAADDDYIEIYDDPTSTTPIATLLSSDLTFGFDPTFLSKNDKIKIVFVSGSSGVNSGFTANLSCAAGTTTKIDAAPATTTGCSGIITDDGGLAGKYLTGKTYTKTICSGSSKSVRLEFVNVTSIHRLDKLVIFDGSSATAGNELIQLGGVPSSDMVKYTNNLAFINTASTFDQIKVQSSGTCLTLQWTSDGTQKVYSGSWGSPDINEDGFTILYSCSDVLIRQPGNFCPTAYTMCDVNGVEGITSSFYAANQAGTGATQFCPTANGGLSPCTSMSASGVSIENNSYVKFVANGTTANFDVDVPFCFDGASSSGGNQINGIQIRVFDGTACNSFTTAVSGSMKVIVPPGTSSSSSLSPSPYTLQCTGLTVGKTYVIVVDGFGGSVCGYKISSTSGITIADAGPDQNICTTTATLAAVGSGTWNATSINTTANVTSVNANNSAVTGLQVGSNKFVWTVSGACSSVKDTVDIILTAITPPLYTKSSINCDPSTSTLGSITITPTSNATRYTYAWTTPITSPVPALNKPSGATSDSAIVKLPSSSTQYCVDITSPTNAGTSGSQTLLSENFNGVAPFNYTLDNSSSTNNIFDVTDDYIGGVCAGLGSVADITPATGTTTSGNKYLHIRATGNCGGPTCGSGSVNFPPKNPNYCSSAVDQKCTFKSLSTVGKTGIRFTCKWLAKGDNSGNDYGKIEYSTNGTAWTPVGNKLNGQPAWQGLTLTDPAWDNQATLYFRIRWVNNASSSLDPPLAVDDITITSQSTSPSVCGQKIQECFTISCCETITVPTGGQSLCLGGDPTVIGVTTSATGTNAIKFVYSTTKQTTAAGVYALTNVIGTSGPGPATGIATLDMPVLGSTGSLPNVAATYYVYAILASPSNASCRDYQEIVIIVNPTLTPTVTCGTITVNSVQFTWPGVTGATSYDASYTVGTASAQAVTGIPNPYSVTGLNVGDVVVIEVTPIGAAGTCFAKGTGTCTAAACTMPTITTQPSTTPKCEGSPETLSVVATGGNGYQWQISTDNGTTFTDIAGATNASYSIADNTGLNNNQYQVIVKESNNLCPRTSAPVTLIVNPILTPTVSCGTSTVSSVQFTWPGVTGATSYNASYKIGTGSAQAVTGIPNPYSVTGLSVNDQVVIEVTPIGASGTCFAKGTGTCTASNCTAPSITSQPSTTPKCEGNPETFSVVATGGSGYQWQISTNNGTTFTDISGETNASFNITDNTGLNNNKYRVIVKESNNLCPTTSNAVTLIVNSIPTASITGTTTICAGNTTPINFTGTPNSIVTYTIDGGANVTVTLNASGVASVNTPIALSTNSTYDLVSVLNPTTSCTKTVNGSAVVTVKTALQLIVTNPAEVCQPATVDITEPNLISGNLTGATITYCSNSAGTILLTSPNSIRNSGTYYIKSTGFGCTTIVPIIVKVNPKPKANFVPTPPNVTTINSKSLMLNTSLNAVDYSWIFSDGTVSSDVSPEHEFPSIEQSKQVVILIATSDAGCKDTTNKIINVNEEVIYYVPNTFTPDNDDFNQVFKPVFTSGFDPSSYHLSIFNRWGELVFESYDPTFGWSGLYGKDGVVVQEGSYTWKIDFKLKENDTRKIEVGSVSVLK